MSSFRQLYKKDNESINPDPKFIESMIENLHNQQQVQHIKPVKSVRIRHLPAVIVCAAAVCIIAVTVVLSSQDYGAGVVTLDNRTRGQNAAVGGGAGDAGDLDNNEAFPVPAQFDAPQNADDGWGRMFDSPQEEPDMAGGISARVNPSAIAGQILGEEDEEKEQQMPRIYRYIQQFIEGLRVTAWQRSYY
jgi:hypothetical protein